MRQNELSQSYAQAAYDAATGVWIRTLEQFNEALEGKPGLLMNLRDPGTTLPEKQKLVAENLPEDTPQEIRNFISVLLSRGDISLLPEIITQFSQLAIHGPQARLVRVTSAVPLTDQEKESLAVKLAGQFGENLSFEYSIDSALLGGLVIRVGDRLIDASVAGKLQALRDRLVEQK